MCCSGYGLVHCFMHYALFTYLMYYSLFSQLFHFHSLLSSIHFTRPFHSSIHFSRLFPFFLLHLLCLYISYSTKRRTLSSPHLIFLLNINRGEDKTPEGKIHQIAAKGGEDSPTVFPGGEDNQGRNRILLRPEAEVM